MSFNLISKALADIKLTIIILWNSLTRAKYVKDFGLVAYQKHVRNCAGLCNYFNFQSVLAISPTAKKFCIDNNLAKCISLVI